MTTLAALKAPFSSAGSRAWSTCSRILRAGSGLCSVMVWFVGEGNGAGEGSARVFSLVRVEMIWMSRGGRSRSDRDSWSGRLQQNWAAKQAIALALGAAVERKTASNVVPEDVLRSSRQRGA
eukprot:3555037-Pleurochrysis_carterae.AAC.2